MSVGGRTRAESANPVVPVPLALRPLEFSSTQVAQLVEHARRCYPAEACGLIAGRTGRATRTYPIRNVERNPRRYRMDAVQQERARARIRANGEELLALYHSHPRAPAYPSARDVELACFPDSAYLIVSLSDPSQPVVRAYRIADGQVWPWEMRIAQPPPAAGWWRRLFARCASSPLL